MRCFGLVYYSVQATYSAMRLFRSVIWSIIKSSFYRTDFFLKGCSNYAFPLVLKKANFKNRDLLEKIMLKNKIEFRRGNAGGGNQLRQPYLKNFLKKVNLNNFKQVDHIHFFGYYIGNYPSLKKEKILEICKILNNIDYE